MKRSFDVAAAGIAFTVSLPLFAICSILVKISSPGPVLFGHRRVGLHGRRFECLKFRTMVDGAEDWLERDSELRERYRENGFKLPRRADPRVTLVGRFLRYTHLDELPQLWNVLRGDMSMVGPRPIVEDELEHYGNRKADLTSVRPGVFGVWTAMGSHRPKYPDRVDVELSYLNGWSFMRDARILVSNLPVLFRGQKEEKGREAWR